MVKLQLEYAPTPRPLEVVCGSVVDRHLGKEMILSVSGAVKKVVPNVEIEKITKVVTHLVKHRELSLRDCCYMVHPAHVYEATAIYHSAFSAVQSFENQYPGTIAAM